MLGITEKTSLFSDVVREAAKENIAPEIIATGLNSDNSDAILIAANSISDALDRQKVKQALLGLLQSSQLSPMNYRTFERLYHVVYQFPAEEAQGICEREKNHFDEMMMIACLNIKKWQFLGPGS